jgi:hypothetical protein
MRIYHGSWPLLTGRPQPKCREISGGRRNFNDLREAPKPETAQVGTDDRLLVLVVLYMLLALFAATTERWLRHLRPVADNRSDAQAPRPLQRAPELTVSEASFRRPAQRAP